MKAGISAALLAHYAQGSTSLCTCWKVTRTDDEVLGYTDLDKDVTFEGVTYLASSGFSPSNVETQSRLAVDNLEAVGVLDNVSLTVEDLAAGVWDFAAVEVFRVNWRDLSMGRDILMTGRLGAVDQSRDGFKAELRGLTNAYAQTVGSVCQPACRATLGDARCQVDLAPYTVTGTLEAVSDDGIVLTDSTRTEPGPAGGKTITGISRATLPVVTCVAHGFVAGQITYIAGVVGMLAINGQFYVVKTVPSVDSFTLAGTDTTNFVPYASGGTATPQGDAGYFDYGKLTMTTGDSAGLSAEVKAYSPGTITLQVQLPRGAAVGDEYTLVAGCGKRFNEDCVGRFDNGINFRGEPHLPGIDQILRVGGA